MSETPAGPLLLVKVQAVTFDWMFREDGGAVFGILGVAPREIYPVRTAVTIKYTYEPPSICLIRIPTTQNFRHHPTSPLQASIPDLTTIHRSTTTQHEQAKTRHSGNLVDRD